jgi:hypothetical protein
MLPQTLLLLAVLEEAADLASLATLATAATAELTVAQAAEEVLGWIMLGTLAQVATEQTASLL